MRRPIYGVVPVAFIHLFLQLANGAKERKKKWREREKTKKI
jgi:hypothetical protein